MLIIVFAVAFFVARAAVTMVLTADGMTGGGTASAAAGNLRLSGAIDGFGLPDGYAALSQGGTTHLEVGQLPALNAPDIPPQNAADPAWLKSEPGLTPVRPIPNKTKGFNR